MIGDLATGAKKALFLRTYTKNVSLFAMGEASGTGDTRRALAAANATRPDAAIVDIGLPDREGIDLAYQLAALPWRPRVVLTSTDSDAGRTIDARDGRPTLPFIPKEDLANSRLRRLLMSG